MQTQKRNICIITGSRAEFSLLKNLINKLTKEESINLSLIVTGSHLSPYFGETIKEIIDNGFKINSKVDLNLKSDSPKDISKATANGIKGFSELFLKSRPDLLIVCGDRYEIFSAVLPACYANIPIAHIHGGERTEGAIDESIRHAITKFSQLHFVACEEYRNRVIQLGEDPKRVFNVGGLGVDAIENLNLLSKSEITKNLEIKIRKRNLIVTYHPETLNKELSDKGIVELLKSLSKVKNTTLIFTLPNADTNNKFIIQKIKNYVKKKENAYLFDSLGQLNYFSLLAICDGVVGNSSSGLLEVPYFKKATINIGLRQKGRLKAKSVIDCDPEENQISKAIEKIYTNTFRKDLSEVDCPYGKAGATDKIVNILKKTNFKHLTNKSFYDLKK